MAWRGARRNAVPPEVVVRVCTREAGIMVQWWQNFQTDCYVDAAKTCNLNSDKPYYDYVTEALEQKKSDWGIIVDDDYVVFKDQSHVTWFMLRWS